jgi:hypothetical protein
MEDYRSDYFIYSGGKMNEYKIIAKGVTKCIVIKAESEEAAMLCAQMSGLKVKAILSVPKAESMKKDSDSEIEKRDAAIMTWCELDNLWGRFEKRKIKCSTDKVCDAIQTDIDSARHAVMQSCGIEDYDEMVEFVEDSGVARWDESQDTWILNKDYAA